LITINVQVCTNSVVDKVAAILLPAFITVAICTDIIKKEPSMNHSINPQRVDCRQVLRTLLPVNRRNSFLVVDGDGRFILAEFTEDLELTSQEIDFAPPEPTDEYGSDPVSGLIWAIRGRGLYVYDLENGVMKHRSFTVTGDEEIQDVMVCDSRKKKILIDVFQLWDEMSRLYVYDVANDSMVSNVLLKTVSFVKIDEGQLLFSEPGGSATPPKIGLLEITNDGIRVDTTSRLVTSLMQRGAFLKDFQISAGSLEKSLFCEVDTKGKRRVLCSVRWRSTKDEASVEPWTIQCAEEFHIGPTFNVDPSGSWMRAPVFEVSNIRSTHSVLFHLSSKYPQGVSVPIMAEGSNGESPGVFVQHEKWGGLYLEPDPGNPNLILVYRLQDAQRIAETVTPPVGKK
jgi:hypothetical protein